MPELFRPDGTPNDGDEDGGGATWVEPDIWTPGGEFDDRKAAAIFAESHTWPGDQKAAMLAWLEATAVRSRIKTQYRHPAELAAAVDPDFVITPALDIISRAIEAVLQSPKRINLLITMPPQEGKSKLTAVWSPIRALQLNANRKIILSSYGDVLAHGHSRESRDIIAAWGSGVTDPLTQLAVPDKLGLKLASGHNRMDSWGIVGGTGGMVAAGLGSTITGKPADCFIIDDPYKNMVEADSKAHREKVDTWFASVVRTRLSPGASIILIQTRWHPEDLAGKVLAAEKSLPREHRSWKHINIPAISQEGVPDALHRQPGVPMVSCRDTPDAKRDFPSTRRDVGERVWFALYQGVPANPEGGLFSRSWFADHRVDEAPVKHFAAIVAIDPADSGDNDETGIIGAVLRPSPSGDPTGQIVLTEDWSGMFTSKDWSRQAVNLALTIGAREIALEGFAAATTYMQVVKRAWRDIHKEAVDKRAGGGLLTPVEQRALASDMPFTVRPWRSAGDDVARSAYLRQAVETGKCVTVDGPLATFEDQACDWQAGQHQPDRVAAAVIAHDRLAELGRGRVSFGSPVPDARLGRTRPEPPAWLRKRIVPRR